MKMKARIKLIIEEEFDTDAEQVKHDTLPYQVDNFRGLSREDQQHLHERINTREMTVLDTRINATKDIEQLVKNKYKDCVEVLVESVEEVT